MIMNNGEKSSICCSYSKGDFYLTYDSCVYKALNGYINIDLSTYVQFFSDSDRYP